jgi:transposase-like protein
VECPFCSNRTPTHLDGASDGARVDYYRCSGCGCVWNVEKTTPHGPVHVVNFQPIKSIGYRPPARKKHA